MSPERFLELLLMIVLIVLVVWLGITLIDRIETVDMLSAPRW